MLTIDSILRKLHKEHYCIKASPGSKQYKLISLLRVRNESLILHDTLEHLSQFSDGIIAYDDCSTDDTFSILEQHPKVLAIIKNPVWASTVQARLKAETLHRKKLMDLALHYHPEWLFCADADERYIGDIKRFIHSESSEGIDGVRISLFDAYMTPSDHLPYQNGQLMNFRKNFGIERRDILMLWRAESQGYYKGLDCREPKLKKTNIATMFFAQHYGKSLSIEHWENTCDYYINFFPFETYGKKWSSRKGKGIHTVSDFETRLYEWGDELFQHAIPIHPLVSKS